MIAHPEIYPHPIPAPKLGIVELLTGRPHFHREPNPPPQEQAENDTNTRKVPLRPPPAWFEIRWVILRVMVALCIAGLAALWLGRRFSKPLIELAKGAESFQTGNFDYRIPVSGKTEFATVANAMNEMAKQVHDQITRLEKDAERRRQFLANVAHELRSPVTTMRTMAGALQDGIAEKPERRETAISALVRTSERMLRLVQDIMELAKLDLDELPLDLKPIDLRELIVTIIECREAAASAAGIKIHPPEIDSPIEILADEDRIIQVLDNILDNTISHAGSGSQVKINIEEGNPLRIIVQDTGRGIPSDELPYVFDSFYRGDTARTPGEHHSGLGLSIAKGIIDAHGGSLIVESEEGVGTTVTILLPKATKT